MSQRKRDTQKNKRQRNLLCADNEEQDHVVVIPDSENEEVGGSFGATSPNRIWGRSVLCVNYKVCQWIQLHCLTIMWLNSSFRKKTLSSVRQGETGTGRGPTGQKCKVRLLQHLYTSIVQCLWSWSVAVVWFIYFFWSLREFLHYWSQILPMQGNHFICAIRYDWRRDAGPGYETQQTRSKYCCTKTTAGRRWHKKSNCRKSSCKLLSMAVFRLQVVMSGSSSSVWICEIVSFWRMIIWLIT